MTVPTFPTLPGLAWPIKRSPVWSTLKQTAISGIETRIPLWTYPLYSYEIAFDVLRASTTHQEWQQLEALYNEVSGSAFVFKFRDAADCTATDQLFGTGDGVTTTFQLVRSLGGFVVPVFSPDVGGVVYLNGSPQVGITQYITTNTAKIVFVTAPPPGALLTWTGTYHWFCRFDEDNVEFAEFASGFWSVDKLKFTTIKL